MLVSSHVLAEVAQSVDDVVVIADGELRAQGTLEQVLGGDDGPATEVRAQDPVRLTARARAPRPPRRSATATSCTSWARRPSRSARSPATSGVAVLGLAASERSLEEAFLALTGARA